MDLFMFSTLTVFAKLPGPKSCHNDSFGVKKNLHDQPHCQEVRSALFTLWKDCFQAASGVDW